MTLGNDSDSDSGLPFRLRPARDDGHSSDDEGGGNLFSALGAGLLLGVLAADKIGALAARRLQRRRRRQNRPNYPPPISRTNSMSWDQFSMSDMDTLSEIGPRHDKEGEKKQLPLPEENLKTLFSGQADSDAHLADKVLCECSAGAVPHDPWARESGTEKTQKVRTSDSAARSTSPKPSCASPTITHVRDMVYSRVADTGEWLLRDAGERGTRSSCESRLNQEDAALKDAMNAESRVVADGPASSWKRQRKASGLVDLFH